ncbi:nuclear transport factor 2 family protein [Rhodococcus wratislaviensis]|uniref:nuclear transport factor 2 family protein n=1 Tax=Rhodococcus wratislaviensis TaxID=44752 RepID=UPI003657F8DA
MSVTETNRRIVTEMYEAGQRGELETFFGHVADDVVLTEPAYLPYGGTYRGAEAVREVFGVIAGYLDMNSLTIDRLVADEDHVFAILSSNQIATGERIMLTELSILREGKVAEFRVFFHEAGSLLELASTDLR